MPAFAAAHDPAATAAASHRAHALYWTGSATPIPSTEPGEKPSDPGMRYWPSDLLYAFTLRMAARGQCVSASMMLGDRSYALAQLRHAHAIGDEELRGLVTQLFGFFSGAGITGLVRPAGYAN